MAEVAARDLARSDGSDGYDPDRRRIAGWVVAAADAPSLAPGTRVEVIFRDENIVIHDDAFDVVRMIEWSDVSAVQLSGRGELTRNTGTNIIGGGFGATAAIEGIAVASLINSLTRKQTTAFECFVHVKAGRFVVLFRNTMASPMVWGVRLAPVLERIARSGEPSMHVRTQKTGDQRPRATGELAKLVELRDAGVLTAEEFLAAKTRLLRTAPPRKR